MIAVFINTTTLHPPSIPPQSVGGRRKGEESRKNILVLAAASPTPLKLRRAYFNLRHATVINQRILPFRH
jgi:hypothetical protein